MCSVVFICTPLYMPYKKYVIFDVIRTSVHMYRCLCVFAIVCLYIWISGELRIRLSVKKNSSYFFPSLYISTYVQMYRSCQ